MLPQTSAAMNLRVTVNLLAQTTLLVASLTKLIVGVPLQLSLALTPAVVCAGTADAHVTVNGAGQDTVGGVLSRTVRVC